MTDQTGEPKLIFKTKAEIEAKTKPAEDAAAVEFLSGCHQPFEGNVSGDWLITLPPDLPPRRARKIARDHLERSGWRVVGAGHNYLELKPITKLADPTASRWRRLVSWIREVAAGGSRR